MNADITSDRREAATGQWNGNATGLALGLAIAVFFVSLAIGFPSCRDSYWVDELHTAWCIDGALREVASRAAMGHQSPIYYWALWCYRSVGGDGETVMRMTSLLAGSSAAAVVAYGLAVRGSLGGGLAGGLILAIDANVIFFATELRPYGIIMLAASVWWMTLIGGPIGGRIGFGNGWDRWWATVLMAGSIGWVHPTAAGPPLLVLLVLSFGGRSIRRLVFGWGSVALSMSCLWWFVMAPTWADRGQWAGFAVAQGWRDFAAIWNWWPLVILPAIGFAATWFWPPGGSASRSDIGTSTPWRWGVLSLAVVVVSTVFFFVASSQFGIHLWHRRYMVVLLPISATAVGLAVAVVEARWADGPIVKGRHAAGAMRRFTLATATTVVAVACLIVQQGTWRALISTQPVVVRDEDWRSASAWINETLGQPDLIWVDSGLIESSGVNLAMQNEGIVDRAMSRYLCYPLLGPYRVGSRQEPFSVADMIAGDAPLAADSGVAVVRNAGDSVAQIFAGRDVSVVPFGRVCVVLWPAPVDRRRLSGADNQR